MATTNEHIAARNDPDLLDRFVAAAEQMGILDASSWVQSSMGRLVSATVNEGQTVADVHAHAAQVRDAYLADTPPRPGQDLEAVTDEHLTAAIHSIRGE